MPKRVSAPPCCDLKTGSSGDRKSTRLNSSHPSISYAVFCLKKKNNNKKKNIKKYIFTSINTHTTKYSWYTLIFVFIVSSILFNIPLDKGISTFFFFFNDTATTEIYTLSLHDALPISVSANADESITPRQLSPPS